MSDRISKSFFRFFVELLPQPKPICIIHHPRDDDDDDNDAEEEEAELEEEDQIPGRKQKREFEPWLSASRLILWARALTLSM